jgi:ribose transport system permease protein
VANTKVKDMIQKFLSDPILGVIVLLLLVGVVASFTIPVFFTLQNIMNLLSGSYFVMLLVAGMTVVLISGGIDLSIGSVMALCAGVVAQLALKHLPVPIVIIVAFIVGALVGCLNGIMVTFVGLPDFIATLATSGFATGILYIWTKGTPIVGYMTPTYKKIGGLSPIYGYITVPMITAIVVALILGGLLKKTHYGVYLFAVGSNRIATRQSGISVPKIRIFAYVVAGLCAALSGVIMAGRNTTVPPDLGVGYEILAIAAAVIGGASLGGGRGRILGAILGEVVLAMTINIINLLGVPSSYQKIFIGGILLLAVFVNQGVTVLRTRFLVRRTVTNS